MSSSASWKIRIRNKVLKELEKFPSRDRERILDSAMKLISNPYAGDVEKMKGEENTWRKRIGSYRIFYEIMILDKVIFIFHVERRTSKTY